MSRLNLVIYGALWLILLWSEYSRHDFPAGTDWSVIVSELASQVFIFPAALLVGWILGRLLNKYPLKLEGLKMWTRRQPNPKIPFWMSRKRIAFSGDFLTPMHTVQINEIKSVAADFAGGSPALKVRLPSKTLILVSSEMRVFTRQLYTLRPELETLS